MRNSHPRAGGRLPWHGHHPGHAFPSKDEGELSLSSLSMHHDHGCRLEGNTIRLYLVSRHSLYRTRTQPQKRSKNITAQILGHTSEMCRCVLTRVLISQRSVRLISLAPSMVASNTLYINGPVTHLVPELVVASQMVSCVAKWRLGAELGHVLRPHQPLLGRTQRGRARRVVHVYFAQEPHAGGRRQQQ